MEENKKMKTGYYTAIFGKGRQYSDNKFTFEYCCDDITDLSVHTLESPSLELLDALFNEFYSLKPINGESEENLAKYYRRLLNKAYGVASMVNHPEHYNKNGYECIDIMLATQGLEATLGFCICNAFKYIYRHNSKNGIEDIKKAKWYIDKYLDLKENYQDEKQDI